MKKKHKRALKLSIDHWERMIKWVEKQNKDAKINISYMLVSIKEDWSSKFCELCQLNLKNCYICLMYNNGIACSDRYSLWRTINGSKNWENWLYHAEMMLKFLKKLK